MLKKCIIVLLTIALGFTFMPIGGADEAQAAWKPFCSTQTNKMKTAVRSLENLLNTYERNMNYANDPFHADYREDHIRLAMNALEMALGKMDHIAYLIGQLAICEGGDAEDLADLEQALDKFFQLAAHPALIDSEHGEAGTFFRKYGSTIVALIELKEHPVYSPLYMMFLANPDSETKERIKLIEENYQANLLDVLLFRIPSLDKEASAAHNMTVAADGLYNFTNLVKTMLDDYKDLKNSPDFDPNAKFSFLKSAFGTWSGGNLLAQVKSMGTKTFIQTYLQETLVKTHMSPEQQEFGNMIAGDLASLMVSMTDPVSLGFAYGELVHDINDYIVKHLEAVAQGMKQDDPEVTRQQVQLLSAATTYTYNLQRQLNSPGVTQTQFITYFEKQTEQLGKELETIYNIDPNEIKIYYQGKRLHTSNPPFIQNGTTMVPLRLIVEELGVDITWNGKEQTITFVTDRSHIFQGKEAEIVMTVGETLVKLGPYYSSLQEAPVLKHGTTYVPLRFMSEHMGLKVKWIPESKSILLE